MNLDFPHELFTRYPECHDLDIRVAIGREIARTSTIKFVGIAKDAAPYIDRNICLAKQIGKEFSYYDIFIYENDSVDNTVEILTSHGGPYMSFLSEKRPDLAYVRDDSSDVDPFHYKRCVKLAEARNKYTELDYSTFDYICVIDWDIKGGWWIDGFFNAITSLNYMPNAGAVSTFGAVGLGQDNTDVQKLEDADRILMFDSFAFRHRRSPEQVHINRVGQSNYLKPMVGSDPVEVKSNFGGLAIYKREAFDGRKYEAKHWEPLVGEVDCDHVCLHRQMREDGFTIYIDPTFLSSHSEHRYNND
jgi:hypothetical protein